MNFKSCKLKPKLSLHLGEREHFREGTQTFVHSDTLFSAFCHSYLLLYGTQELEKFLQKFIEIYPPILISSAFPYWNDKYYFPIPENQLPEEKEFKKKEFVEKEAFERLISGERIEKIEPNRFIPDEKNESPYTIVDIPRVGLSRLTNHPGENYFHFGEVIYKENSGLFFLYEIKDENIEKQFQTTIRLLADEGIGGDRSSGKGLFYQPEFLSININVPEDIQSIITLSLYCPRENELTDVENSYYQLISRKGYIYSPYCQSFRRKSVRMFTEGSVFPSKKTGRIVDVTPEIFTEHKIYRYGFVFALPCVLEIRDEN